MECSPNFRRNSGYLHGLAIIIITVFSGIQIYDLERGSPQ